jgi:hydrogenase 3 maturation protease
METLKETLTSLLYGKPLLIGLGNRIRGDDGIGSILAERLKDKLGIDVIDAEMSVENYIGPVIKKIPDTVIIVDAINFNSEPGAICIYSDIEIPVNHFSTHGMSLQFLVDYLKNAGITSIILIGVQPQMTKLDSGMSTPVKEAMDKLERLFADLFRKRE